MKLRFLCYFSFVHCWDRFEEISSIKMSVSIKLLILFASIALVASNDGTGRCTATKKWAFRYWESLKRSQFDFFVFSKSEFYTELVPYMHEESFFGQCPGFYFRKCRQTRFVTRHRIESNIRTVTEIEKTCCSGYVEVAGECYPQCIDCENGKCTAPNICLCNEGYVNDLQRWEYRTSFDLRGTEIDPFIFQMQAKMLWVWKRWMSGTDAMPMQCWLRLELTSGRVCATMLARLRWKQCLLIAGGLFVHQWLQKITSAQFVRSDLQQWLQEWPMHCSAHMPMWRRISFNQRNGITMWTNLWDTLRKWKMRCAKCLRVSRKFQSSWRKCAASLPLWAVLCRTEQHLSLPERNKACARSKCVLWQRQ